MRYAAIILAVALLAGCAGARQRAQIDQGLLTVGLIQDSFLSTWGPPDRTTVAPGAEAMGATWSGGLGGGFEFSKGARVLEVWHYEERSTDLVFDRKRLVNWHTDKTRAELAK